MSESSVFRIAHLGTFDVENYGDLLFPLIAKRRLTQAIPSLHIDWVSPVGGELGWQDTIKAMSYPAFASTRRSYRGILVGGGNIIRLNPSDLPAYQIGDAAILAYANLWASVVADKGSAPICWNAPGVPAAILDELKAPLQECMQFTDYISVRDEESVEYLKDIVQPSSVNIVPDSAWDVVDLWSDVDRSRAYRQAYESRGAQVAQRSVSIHINSRYLGSQTIASIARNLDDISKLENAKVILIAIGRCHGDDEIARQVASFMTTDPLIIDRPNSVLEVAACISHSIAYIGSSMHGFITAAAFGVPAAIVASMEMKKFPGLLNSIDMPDAMKSSWSAAIAQVTSGKLKEMVLKSNVRDSQRALLDMHWNRIVEVFKGSSELRVRDETFLFSVSSKIRANILSIRAPEYFKKSQILRARCVELAEEADAEKAQTAQVLQEAESRLSRERAEFMNSRKQLSEELRYARKNIIEQKDIRKQLEVSLREVKGNFQEQKEKYLRTEIQLQAIQKLNHDILSSTSWLVTAPLRSMHSLVPKFFHRYLRKLAKLCWWMITPHHFPRRFEYLKKHFAESSKTKGCHKTDDTFQSGGGEVDFLGQEVDQQPQTAIIKESVQVPQIVTFKPQLNHRGFELPRIPVAVIIPIYNAAQEAEECIRSVLKHTSDDVQIIVINDASPDPKVKEMLSKFSGDANLQVSHNDVNLGFTRTVNLGISFAGESDVVFLNSDTVVTPLWLRNLQLAAYSDDNVATATPFSNNAGAFSAPEVGKKNEIPDWLSLEEFARQVTRLSKRLYPNTPTGNGYCMYVRRAALDEVGLLDEVAFPRGYGEENDFCMRAGSVGWKHVIDDSTLIYHIRSISFGDEKTQLMKQGRAILDSRYPHYTAEVREFLSNPLLTAARETIAQIYKMAPIQVSIQPRLLFVVSTRTGGTPQTNEDLMAALGDRYETLLLRCNSKTIELFFVQDRTQFLLETVNLTEELKAFPHQSDEYDSILSSFIVQYSIELVHVRHIAWHSLGLPRISKRLSVPVVFSFHDFYTICPTVKLLDENLTFCGGVCTATAGECKHELWRDIDFPPLKNHAIYNWQRNMREMLLECDAFVTTTQGSKDQILKVFPDLSKNHFEVIPHGRDLDMQDAADQATFSSETVRILIPGNIDAAKGASIIERLAELDVENVFEFHILGGTTISPQDKFVFHGPYQRHEFSEKVRAIRPHIGGIFSVWPETFCHTLTEMWGCGLPVVGIDLGAVGERIKVSGGGWALPSTNPEEIYQEMLDIVADFGGYQKKCASVRKWQKNIGAIDTTLNMSHRYDGIYRRLLAKRSEVVSNRTKVALLLPSRSTDFPASSHVRVLEKTRDNITRIVRYDLVNYPKIGDEAYLAQFDAYFVQRTALNRSEVDTIVDLCKSSDKKLIFEIDDDLFGINKKTDTDNDYISAQSALKELAVNADLIVTSTEVLQNRLRQLNPSVVLSKNALSERLWFSPLGSSDGATTYPNRTDTETLILYMGTKTHDEDLAILEQPMRNLRATNPNIRLLTIGVTPQAADWYETVRIPQGVGRYTDFVPWFRGFASHCDFAIAPLHQTHFNAAKSPLKFFDYAGAGLCGIFSNVEPYASLVEHKETGYLSDNDEASWTAAIEHAIASVDERKQMAVRAREKVRAVKLAQIGRELDETIDSLCKSNDRS